MYEELFSQRLAQLRQERGISARDMSLSIGQNPGYINTIENGKAFPTMSSFFYICDFLKISPKDFFDTDMKSPEKFHSIISELNDLSDEQLCALQIIIRGLTHH